MLCKHNVGGENKILDVKDTGNGYGAEIPWIIMRVNLGFEPQTKICIASCSVSDTGQ